MALGDLIEAPKKEIIPLPEPAIKKEEPTSIKPLRKKTIPQTPKPLGEKTRKPLGTPKPSLKPKVGPPDPIRFEGEGLLGKRKDGVLELVKNVKITQGDFYLESDRAKIFFEKDEAQKFYALGRVKMRTRDEKTGEPVEAQGDEAEYMVKEEILILKNHATLKRGKDEMKGDLIEYNKKTGWIKGDKIQGVVESKESLSL